MASLLRLCAGGASVALGACLLGAGGCGDEAHDAASWAAVTVGSSATGNGGMGGSSSGSGDASSGSGGSASTGTGGEGGGLIQVNPESLRVLGVELLGQLTNTSVTPLAPLNLAGTDLGVAFERNGALTFLFGDSWTLDQTRWDHDSSATAPLAWSPGGALPALTWEKQNGGAFRTLSVPGVDLGPMNVPVEGIVVDGRTYVFFSTGYSFKTKVHTHSVLAHTDGATLGALTLDHEVATTRFVNVSLIREGDDVYVYGSGPYRKSAVYLAKVPVGKLAERSAWTYWSGTAFVSGEGAAKPVIDATCVGELSARRHPGLGMILVAYNCHDPRGVVLHAASSPTGPFASGQLLVDVGVEKGVGYGHAFHSKTSAVGYDDGLSERGRDEDWGGEYGPYLVPWWSSPPQGHVHDLVFALSSWNPYQVHLVRAHLGPEGGAFTPPTKGANLPKAALVNGDFSTGDLSGWSASGDTFVVFQGKDAKPRVTTYALPKGDKAMGKLWQDFTVDAATSELRFYIHGGHARVVLLDGTDVVRTSRGREQNEPETLVRWHLASLRGRTLRLQIEDDVTDAWGFVGARGFELL
jgi:hypothetical protein